MARFDPQTYPDRLAFEAHARNLRRAELDRLWSEAAAGSPSRRDEFVGTLARQVGGTGSHSHR